MQLRLGGARRLIAPLLLFCATGCDMGVGTVGNPGNGGVGHNPASGGPILLGGVDLNAAIWERQMAANIAEAERITRTSQYTLAEYRAFVNAFGPRYLAATSYAGGAAPVGYDTDLADSATSLNDIWELVRACRITIGSWGDMHGDSIYTSVSGPYKSFSGTGETMAAAWAAAWAGDTSIVTDADLVGMAAIITAVSGGYQCTFWGYRWAFGFDNIWTGREHSGQMWAPAELQTYDVFYNFGYSQIGETDGAYGMIGSRPRGDWSSWTPGWKVPSTEPPPLPDFELPIGDYVGFWIYLNYKCLLTWEFEYQ